MTKNRSTREGELSVGVVQGDAPLDAGRRATPIGFKVVGALCVLGGLAMSPMVVVAVIVAIGAFSGTLLGDATAVTRVLSVVLVALTGVIAVAYIVLGARLALGRRRGARIAAEFIVALLVASLLCDLMISGVSGDLLVYVVGVVVLVATHTVIDPSLSDERELQKKLRQMETREDAEEGTLGLDETGRGFIALDFFNIFWIFVVACLVGDLIEIVYHMTVVEPGVFQRRTGMLFGPFSPIYGFGAVLMTLALNRFHRANVLVVFLVSAVIGGAFEYLVSWFLQFAFGVVAWDYTGTFLSIGGRTNFMFMCMWGVLGVAWIKLALPYMLKLVNLIPWKLRYTVTTVCAALMIANGAMTLIALDSWYSRLAGLPADNAVEEFCATHYDNEWMANHFQSMTIDPGNATRVR